jgi:hypothetical protein
MRRLCWQLRVIVDTAFMPCLMSASPAKRYSGNQAPGKCQSSQSGPYGSRHPACLAALRLVMRCQALLAAASHRSRLALPAQTSVLANTFQAAVTCLVGLRYSYRRLSPGICCAHVLDTLPQLLGGVDQSRVTAVSSAINDATFPARHERSC